MGAARSFKPCALLAHQVFFDIIDIAVQHPGPRCLDAPYSPAEELNGCGILRFLLIFPQHPGHFRDSRDQRPWKVFIFARCLLGRNFSVQLVMSEESVLMKSETAASRAEMGALFPGQVHVETDDN